MYQIYIIQFSKIRHLLQFWSSFYSFDQKYASCVTHFPQLFPKISMIPTIFDEIYSLIETNERSKIHFISIKKISIKSTRIKPSTNSISIRIASQSFSKISNYIISHLLSQFHQQIHINPNKYLLKLALPTPRFSFNDPTLISIPKVHGTFK